MKRQIRYGMFESNSSTTHCLWMVSSDTYDEFEKGGYLYVGGKFGWEDGCTPKKDTVYSKELVKEMIKKNYKYYTEIDETNKDEDDIKDEWDDMIRDADFISEEWLDNQDCYETFYETYKTEDGEEVVAFGYYGYN